VVNAEGEVTHLLLNLEPGDFCVKSETDNLLDHVRRLESELAEARAEADAAKMMARMLWQTLRLYVSSSTKCWPLSHQVLLMETMPGCV